VQSIKGEGGYIGLEKTGEFLHKMESILERLRQGSMTASEKVIDVLFMGMDTVTSLLHDLSENQQELTSTETAKMTFDGLLEGDGSPGQEDGIEDAEVLDEGESWGEFSSGKPEATAAVEKDEEPKKETEDATPPSLDDEFPDLGEKYGDVDESLDIHPKAPAAYDEDLFGTEISEVLEQHMGELDNALKVLEERKTTGELERFLKLVESFRSSIEYFGYDELDTSLNNISKSIMLFLEEGENLTDNEVLSFYNNLDIIREHINETDPVMQRPDVIVGSSNSAKLNENDAVKEFTIIPGVGAAKARQLYRAGFSSWDALSEASEEALAKVEGISGKLAGDIVTYFQDERESATAAISAPGEPAAPQVQAEPQQSVAEISGEVKQDYDVGMMKS
jgi:chemotaxis protein histidine kinase CheA